MSRFAVGSHLKFAVVVALVVAETGPAPAPATVEQTAVVGIEAVTVVAANVAVVVLNLQKMLFKNAPCPAMQNAILTLFNIRDLLLSLLFQQFRFSNQHFLLLYWI